MNAEWTLETGGAFATALFKRVLRPESDRPVQCGDRVGPYRLEAQIGQGGSSVIFRGTRCDGAFQHEVAVKVLNSKHASDRGVGAEERNLLAKLAHPGIAQIHDGGTTQDGTSWFAMELVSGTSLRQHFERRARHWKDRIQIVLQVVEAIQFAHSKGVIHGDIKPANILIDAAGAVKLVDFGIGSAADSDEVLAIRTAFTPGYASPEQLVGAELTPKSDIFQIGLVIEKHVLHHLRMEATEVGAVGLYRGDAGESISAETYTRLGRICALATEEAPSQRYQSVTQLRAELTALVAGAASTSDAPGKGATSAKPAVGVSAYSKDQSLRPVNWALLLLLMSLCVGNAWFLLGRISEPKSSRTPAASGRSPQFEVRDLDRLALELKTRFDGDWMKRVVAVESLARSYWQLESFEEAYLLASWAAEVSMQDSSAQPRDRLRLNLLKLELAPIDLDPSILREVERSATKLLEESGLGPYSMEAVELLTIKLEVQLRYGTSIDIEKVANELNAILGAADDLQASTRARGEDAIRMLRFFRAKSDETLFSSEKASGELHGLKTPWDIDRLKIAMLRVILAKHEDREKMFAEFLRGLGSIESQYGNESDTYAVGKLYFAIILFESGRPETSQRAADIFEAVSDQLSGRGADFLGHLVLAQSYRALAALQRKDYEAASAAAATASSFSTSMVGPAHPLRRVIRVVSVAAECGREGGRSNATSETDSGRTGGEPTDVDLADIVEFTVLSDCLGASESLVRIGATREALSAALRSNLLSPRLLADAQSTLRLVAPHH